MAQHGQVLKLRSCRSDGKARWAYRYRVSGSCSKRPQVGGFATREEAERALKRGLARFRPGREMTLNELVEEYLRIHQAAPSTLEKLGRVRRGDRAAAGRAGGARAARRRPHRRRGLRPPPARPRPGEAHQDAAERPGRAAAVGRTRGARLATGYGRGVVVPGAPRRAHRSAQLPSPALAASADRRRHRPGPQAVRPAPHIRNFRASRRDLDLRPVRFMGASLAMIDKHYGHLARDGRDHAVALLDAYARDSAAWTSSGRRRRTASPRGDSGCSVVN